MFAKAGYEVFLYDIDKEQTKKALEGVLKILQELENKGLLQGVMKTAEEAYKLVHTCTNLEEALDGAIYVQVPLILWFI